MSGNELHLKPLQEVALPEGHVSHIKALLECLVVPVREAFGERKPDGNSLPRIPVSITVLENRLVNGLGPP